jgi:hypothetical protein
LQSKHIQLMTASMFHVTNLTPRSGVTTLRWGRVPHPVRQLQNSAAPVQRRGGLHRQHAVRHGPAGRVGTPGCQISYMDHHTCRVLTAK